MKQQIKSILIIVFLFVLSERLIAQTAYEIKSYSIVISGTSNLHDWTADVEKVSGSLKLKIENGKISDIQNVEIVVDAASLKGSKGSIMNSKINDALKSEKYPKINFKSTQLGSITENAGVNHINSTGILTIAGVSKSINIDSSGKLLPNGDIELSGIKKIKMTEYKVKPPTAMFGALTTGDEITIAFKVVIKSVQ
ncbi:MAG: YceI family protein [Bacteroidales bacterium]